MPDLSNVFKAYDVRQLYPDPLNEAAGKRIGFGVGTYLKQKNNGSGTVVCSHDHRPSAPSMHQAIMQGIRAAGMNVVDCGKCDTSFQYFAIPHLDAAGGVQTTASHNPIEYIGHKISGPGATPIGRDTGLADIQAIAESDAADFTDAEVDAGGSYETADLWTAYRKHILQFMGELQRPVSVFVDASNGMGTTLLEKVFKDVPNLNITAINNTYTDDWAHEPNPLVAENVVPTQEGVRSHGAALGACFDGDADRCMLVDDAGDLCGCDHLTAWLADHFIALARTDPAAPKPTTILYDLRSSKVVEETILALGAKPAISKVGHVNMKALLRETQGIFGGELSGHFYFKHNSYADSGAITLAVALAVLSQNDQPLSKQIAPFRKYPQSGEINFVNEDKAGTIQKLKDTYSPAADQVLELDGVTIDCFASQGWWCNIRSSNTEPLLRLNMEAKDQATLDKMLAEIKPTLGEVDHGH